LTQSSTDCLLITFVSGIGIEISERGFCFLVVFIGILFESWGRSEESEFSFLKASYCYLRRILRFYSWVSSLLYSSARLWSLFTIVICSLHYALSWLLANYFWWVLSKICLLSIWFFWNALYFSIVCCLTFINFYWCFSINSFLLKILPNDCLF
jgi:hypothetical protein